MLPELVEKKPFRRQNLGNGDPKVMADNHRVDAALMQRCGSAFAEHLSTAPDLVLTAEISGIAPALMTAAALGCKVVYARKKRPVTMPEDAYMALAPSRTKGSITPLMVSPEFLKGGERVLIIDDFLASGQTIQGLTELCAQAGATLVGIGALVEKTFEHGRQLLAEHQVPIYSLAQITSLNGVE